MMITAATTTIPSGISIGLFVFFATTFLGFGAWIVRTMSDLAVSTGKLQTKATDTTNDVASTAQLLVSLTDVVHQMDMNGTHALASIADELKEDRKLRAIDAQRTADALALRVEAQAAELARLTRETAATLAAKVAAGDQHFDDHDKWERARAQGADDARAEQAAADGKAGETIVEAPVHVVAPTPTIP